MPQYDLSSAELTVSGPIIDVVIGHSAPYTEELLRQGLPVTRVRTVKALIDTGAGGIALCGSVASAMKLKIIDRKPILTPTTKQAELRNVYGISLHFAHGPVYPLVGAIDVDLAAQGIHMLLGRQVLAFAKFEYDGKTGKCLFSIDDN